MSNKKKNNNPSQKPFDFYAGNLHLILIFLVSFIFYGNSLSNETALDDVMVLTNNQFVLKGISGIPDIISHESFFGATGKITAALSWRYRPLSLLLFAFEHEFFGNSWTAYHFFNVFFYTVLCMVIYNFFRRHVFKSNSHYALTAALLFSIHPMHTEVVANIKSLDEILALLFSVLFLDSLLKQSLSKSKLEIFKSLLYLLLALMSKESSTLLLALAPIAIYVFNRDSIKKTIIQSIPAFVLIALYTLFRLSISEMPVGKTDIMNDPYLYATIEQKYATILLILGKYLSLLILPLTQCIDYGYNQIPYVELSNSNTLISLVVYVGLLIIGIYSIIKRQPIGFFVISYLLSIVLLSNALVNVGPPMADRFLFAPSLFFIGFLLILIHAISDKINTTAFSYGSKIMLIAFIIFSYIKVYSRNQDWKNNETLYRADIIKSPNSVRMLYYHGGMLLTQSDAIQDSIQKNNLLRMAVNDFNKAHQIYPDYASMYQNYGLAFYRLNNIDSAEWAWNRLKELRPDSKYIANNEYLIATYRFNSWNKKYEAALPR